MRTLTTSLFPPTFAFARILTVLAVATTAACGGGDGVVATRDPALTGIVVAPADLPLAVGSTGQVQATLQGRGASTGQGTITYTSGTPTVATVNAASGLVTAVAPGTSVITATGTHPTTAALASATVTGNITVTVAEPPVGSIDLTVPDTYLQPGPGSGRTSTTIAAVVKSTLGGVMTRTVNWSSSLPAVATVSTSGLVTALSTGSTVVTASVEGVSRTTTINVVRAFAVVEANQPTAATYQAGTNSTGRPNTVTRTSAGLYTITFDGIGTNTIGRNFMFMVNAEAGAPNASLTAIAAVCHVAGRTTATPVTMDVRCEDPVTGVNKDATFRALLIGDFALSGAHAFTLHTIGQTTPYDVSAPFAFNSAAANMGIVPNVEPGSWNNVLTRHNQGVAVPSQLSFAQVVTSLPGRTCHTRNQIRDATTFDILCNSRSTFAVDATHQVLRLTAGRSGRIAGTAMFSAADGFDFGQGFTSAGLTVIAKTGIGKYRVTFPGLTAASGGLSVIPSPWSSNDYLHCVHHVVSSSPVTIDIACVSKTGEFSNSQVSSIQLLVLQ
ncbi:MAG: Ig domain-containing protein [Gemmatimonadaceae bacterium]|nr:Ig domain-containing protein [Gemmatimonadaceae bacterium]